MVNTTLSLMPIYVQVVDLSYTELKDLPEYFLHTPKLLRVLNLTGNLMTQVPVALQHSHALEVLYLSDNPIIVLDRSRYVIPAHMVLCPLPTFCHVAKCEV
jgi:Leucine-rich repeat (LRR) protein